MNMIITSECEECDYGTVFDDEKSRTKVYCRDKDKTYYYGQCIPCENGKRRKIKHKEEECDE